MTFRRAVASLIVASLLVSAPARADDAGSKLVPDQTLLVGGSLVFAAGYVPAATYALPSTAGLAGRAIAWLALWPLLLYACGAYDDSTNDGYLCAGKHGAVMLLIPFAGPLLYAHYQPSDSILFPSGGHLSPLQKDLLYGSSGLQIAGAALMIASVVAGHREPNRPSAAESSKLRILPAITSNSIGISASLTAW